MAKPSKAGTACNQRPLSDAVDGGSGTRSPLQVGVECMTKPDHHPHPPPLSHCGGNCLSGAKPAIFPAVVRSVERQ